MRRRPQRASVRSPWRAAALAGLLSFGLASSASAAPPGEFDDVLAEPSRTLELARGPEAIAALRELWRTWDIADPDSVEATLAAHAADPTVPAPVRAYAATLEAYARRRRGDLDGAERRLAALGIVHEWLVVGPFENQNRTGLGERVAPELELDAPILLDRGFQGKVRPVGWRIAPSHRLGWVDLGSLVRPTRDVCVLASTFVRSPRARDLTVFVGAAGAFKLYLDTDEVLVDGGYRELDPDRHAVAVRLEADRFHRLTLKVCGAANPPMFTLRLADEAGAPATPLDIEATERASARAASQLRALRGAAGSPDGSSERPPPRPASKGRAEPLLGPIQAFDRRLASAPEDPETLEAYARYLAVTGGDAEDDPQARDLAERAAARAPTVRRHLLAADLAEDRNGRREHVEHASQLARTRAERIAVLRAQMALARTGPSAHDVLPLVRELLLLAPEDPIGRLGLVERYDQAGLRRTAAAELDRALALRPRSVALLRAAAAAQRSLGRDAVAAGLDLRADALRGDDATTTAGHLDLAVARRDDDRARRLAARLLRLEPTNAWVHGRVARALRALGDAAGAEATYRRLLAAAPEDAATLRELADLRGELGDLPGQLDFARSAVRVAPQDPAARDYLERLEPRKHREDEQLAWPHERFRELAAISPATDAALRVLRRLEVTTVLDGGLATRFHQRVFQPLTEEAARRARRFAFAYHSDRQAVEVRGVRVFRKDGKIDETFTTGEGPLDDPSIQMYTLERVFYVQLPELHVGDVVELRYRVDDVTPQSDTADYFGEVVTLQELVPVASAEYVLSTPAALAIHARASGLPGLVEEVTAKAGRTVRRFAARDLPAAIVEPGRPPLQEALGLVHVSSMPDWAAVGRWYWALAKDKLEPDEDIRRVAAKVTAGAPDLEAKVAAVYRHAASETRYVALEFGIEGIRPRRASLTLARGWGDCKDKAALIVSMLRALGIDAELVLVRTGMRGRFDAAIASLAPFDHAIAYVPALDRYLDGTAESTGSGELPTMDRGALALRISGGEGKLVELPELVTPASREEQDVALQLEPDGRFRFQVTLTATGVEAPAWRRRFQSESTRRERLRSDLAAPFGQVELDPGSVEATGVDAFEAPVVIRARGRGNAGVDGVAWSVPLGGRTSLAASLAALPSRRTPLLLGPPRAMTMRWSVQVPPGARILSQPAAVTFEDPAGRFELRVESDGQRVTVVRSLELRRSRVEPSAYPAWQEFCRRVDAASGARLLLAR